MKKYVRIAVSFILVAGLLAFLVPAGKAPSMVASLALIVGMSLLAARPRSRAFARAHARGMRTAAVVLIVAMFGVISVPIIWPELGLSGDLSVGISVGCMVCAAFLFTLPSTAGQIEVIEQVTERRKIAEASAEAPKAKFSGPGAVIDAFRFLAGHPYVLLRLVGPWALLFWAAPLTATLVMGQLNEGGASTPGLVVVLLVVALIPMILAVPLAAIAWARFTATGATAMIARPGVLWSYLWRIWLVSSMLGTGQKMLEPQAQRIVTDLGFGDAEVLGRVIMGLAYVVIAFALGQFALVLPAIAVGDRTVTKTLYGVAAQRLGRSYLLGVPLAIAPFALAVWAMDRGISSLKVPMASALWWGLELIPMLVTFLGLAVLINYLTRAYQWAKAEMEIEAYEPVVVGPAA